MGFSMVTDYKVLKASLNSQIEALRGTHRAATEDLLREPRRTQVLFLRKAIELLEEKISDNDNRVKILYGLLLNIQNGITGNSFFKEALDVVLGITETNKLDPQTAEQLHNAGLSFFKTIIMDDNQQLLKTSPFAHLKYFDDKDFVARAYQLIHRDGVGAHQEKHKELAAAILAEEKAAAAKMAAEKGNESSSSYWFGGFNLFGGSSSSSAPVAFVQPNITVSDDEDECVMEDSDDESPTNIKKTP